MAHIETQMVSLGVQCEKCSGCDRQFERGETMNAVVSESGEPIGWFCKCCIADWREKGIKSRVFNDG